MSAMVPGLCFVFFVHALAAAENLIPNATFTEADPADATRPLHWGRPDGLGVTWLPLPAGSDGIAGKGIRFDTSVSERDMVAQWAKIGSTEWGIPDAGKGPVGATYGLSLYSDPVAIAKGTPYAIEVRHRGPGGGKIWVRGYTRRGETMKRVYEAQTSLPAKREWTDTRYVFHPTRHTPTVTEVRVMLYAYWPAAESWFADVRLTVAGEDELKAEDARKER